ncbi:MAG: DUF3795 domain-containing protein [Thermoplasmata archaeon]|nr:DUF3795 domain-containing protein [Thermoplasmata archaeon]NIS13866.1 DUF3795 domain-containing protein [Thermoplasmata archaeon]NIS21535.1 DUF3795 domain-containing protein [Thermoplasmata archaeon]NIT79101.1 DUF3795 domain-containing protein [Thermoplasmata archaeon]NIU50574.1 DUF3795 domain-containing protein [Thermoplasmata archaeon]
MDEEVSYCGLVCAECPAYRGTRDGDVELLERAAKVWSEHYDEDLTADSIRCDGCKSLTGPHSVTCVTCKIRICAKDRGVENCALCDEYGCDILEGILSVAPEAREKLEEIRTR